MVDSPLLVLPGCGYARCEAVSDWEMEKRNQRRPMQRSERARVVPILEVIDPQREVIEEIQPTDAGCGKSIRSIRLRHSYR
jgi:hypothetical protein